MLEWRRPVPLKTAFHDRQNKTMQQRQITASLLISQSNKHIQLNIGLISLAQLKITCHDNYTAGRLSLWFTFAICYKFFILVVVISMHFHVTTCKKKSKHDWVSKNTSSGQWQQETQQWKWSSLYHYMHKLPWVVSAKATNNYSSCATFHSPLRISQIFLFLACVCVCVTFSDLSQYPVQAQLVAFYYNSLSLSEACF